MVNVNTFNFTTDGQLLVSNAPTDGAVSIDNHFGESSIASGSTSTVVTYTVPSGKQFLIRYFSFGGRADGEAYLEINSSNEDKLQNSAAGRSDSRSYPDGILVDESIVINLKITNCGDSLQSFHGTFQGREFDKI